jgi:pimeloyl-ACP methyl ester carboxylesterase
MTVVLVHGFPDVAAVWNPLRAALPDEGVVAVALPGFGGPRPAGFGATRWDYGTWLEAELRRLDGPIDLVAHDVGSVIAHHVLREAPELVRSWVLSGVCDPDFGWHRHGRMFQTSGLGEQSRAAWASLDTATRAVVLASDGLPHAQAVAEHFDDEMFGVALDWYRSVSFFGDWQLEPSAALPPGMFLWGIDDPYQSVDFGLRAAKRLGRPLVALPTGHWWHVERPQESADVLRAFWARVRSEVGAPA